MLQRTSAPLGIRKYMVCGGEGGATIFYGFLACDDGSYNNMLFEALPPSWTDHRPEIPHI